MTEGKDFTAGFTVVDPDGKTRFIGREESMKPPFNIKDGISENVPGLNQIRLTNNEGPKIVNPETLKQIKDNEGKIDISMMPGVPEAAENLKRGYEEMVKTFVAPDVSDPAKYTAMSMREWLGVNARNRDRFMDSMTKARALFEKASRQSIIDTYTKAQRGEVQDDPNLQKIYVTLQKALSDKAHEVQKETGKLQELIENYLPHAWEDPKRAGNAFRQIFGKRQLEGPKTFLKRRKINDFEEGIKLGLSPISWNPVDLTMYKLTEMDRFLMNYRVRKSLRDQGFEVFLKVGAKKPQGKESWVKIKDHGSDVYKSPMIPVSEYVDAGQYEALGRLAQKFGIKHERKMSMKVLGKAIPPDEIKTKFATDLGTMTHEIGHILDKKYNLEDLFVKDKETKEELRKLADLRYEGQDEFVSDYYKKYVRKGAEKMANMVDAFVNMPDRFKEVAPNTWTKLNQFIDEHPELEDLRHLEGGVRRKELSRELYAGGNVITGHWITHPDAARIIENYLSPGLRGNYFYDIWKTAGNSLIQARLSLSAFHAQFVSNDANISHLALGLSKLASGDVKGAFKSGAVGFMGPVGPIQTLMEGRKVMEAWNGKDNGPLTNMIAELYAKGGGRAKMDKYYAIEADKAINKALKEGKFLTAALNTPFWILQQSNRPLLEYYVPRMKMGVFSNILKFEIEKKPDISHQELLVKAQKAIDTVDDRMGQLVYDNLFLNKTLKDLGMASVQSFGWNIGDVRLFGGGAVDLVKSLNDLRQGKSTELSYRLGYVLGMPIIMGFYGAIYQYLHTGKAPGQGIEDQGMAGVLKDLYFPRNGGYDNHGQEARTSLASYVKDLYRFAEDPVKTVINKLNPLGSDVLNQFNNKDFYGTKIYNEDDPLVQQLIERVSAEVRSSLPYSIQNSQRTPNQDLEQKVENFVGFNPAPSDINMTNAEKEAYKLGEQHFSNASRTRDQYQHSQSVSQLRSQYMKDKDREILDQAVEDGVITAKERRQIIKEANQSNLERLTKNLSFEEVEHVLKFATDNERQELEKILEKKRENKESRGTWTDVEQQLYEESLRKGQ